jgi:hypothetical protein
LTQTIKTSDRTIKWSTDLTQTIETLRTIRLNIDQRRIVKDVHYKLDGNDDTTLELDSHADTCVLGCDALIILDYNGPVSVVVYDESLGSKTYQTVSGVVAYDDPQTGRMLHLIINQAIHIPHLVLGRLATSSRCTSKVRPAVDVQARSELVKWRLQV